MDGLKDKCAIVGIGQTEYTRGTDKSTLRLHLEAGLKAIEDAGITPGDIDAYLPYAYGGCITEQFIVNLGITNLRYSSTTLQGGASCLGSVLTATMAVSCGIANYALITVGRRGYTEQRISAMGQSQAVPMVQVPDISINEFEAPYGVVVPISSLAFGARRHMQKYGTTSRQFGAVAVACRKHAMLNPHAILRKPMTIEDHQNSRMVIDPLRLFDCSVETDGAGAVVITSAERARHLKHRPVYISGIAQGHPDHPHTITQRIESTEITGIRQAAARAFAMAGLTPKDVDVAEICDGLTWILLSSLEDIGFCKKGEGGPFVEGERIELGGELPVNTHGGLLSEAHVSGVNHIIEAVHQLRADAEKRQVKNAEIVLVSGEGNFSEGAVMLLRR